jgi:hypothetical protein
MQITKFISGSPASFVKSVNALIAESDVAIKIHSISCSGSRLTAVVELTSLATNTRGALAEVACLTKDASEKFDELVSGNPCWSALAAFDQPKGKAETDNSAADQPKGLLVVAALCQP